MITFYLDKEQLKYVKDFIDNHTCSLPVDPSTNQKIVGAIGGEITYTFTPTGSGTVTKVHCACGEYKDLTDYDNW